MFLRLILNIALIYAALVLQICCGKWLGADWGRPQPLLLVMVLLSLKDRSGLAVVTSAGIGFLADSLEPAGMGRYFLLFSLVGWWLQRRSEAGHLRHTRTTLALTVAFASLLIPLGGLLIGQLLNPHQLPFDKLMFQLCASATWTLALTIPALLAFRSDANIHRHARTSSSRRWRMLTNS